VEQTIYTRVSKCKNDERRKERERKQKKAEFKTPVM
jgi:hypothetical protein